MKKPVTGGKTRGDASTGTRAGAVVDVVDGGREGDSKVGKGGEGGVVAFGGKDVKTQTTDSYFTKKSRSNRPPTTVKTTGKRSKKKQPH